MKAVCLRKSFLLFVGVTIGAAIVAVVTMLRGSSSIESEIRTSPRLSLAPKLERVSDGNQRGEPRGEPVSSTRLGSNDGIGNLLSADDLTLIKPVELWRAAEHVGVAEFEEVVQNLLQSELPRSLKVGLLKSVVSNVASRMPLDGLVEIVRTVEDDELRGELLLGAFSGSRDSLATVSRLFDEIENDDERRKASAGFYFRLMSELGQRPEYLLEIKGSELPDELVKAAVRALGSSITSLPVADRPARVGVILDWIDSDVRAQNEKETDRLVITAFGDKMPFEVWEYLGKASGEVDREMRGKIARNMVSVDPERAMSEIMNSGSPSDLEAAVNAWSRLDSSKSIAWIESNAAALSPSEISSATSGISQSLAQIGQFDDARAMLSMISDAAIKSKVESRIWSLERESLRSEVGKNPLDAVEAIVADKSKFQEYWLEEAVYSWISKDFDAANAWYQDRWDSLPNSKSQYVAAAFATQAMEQGDTATAREWVAMIQDAKTKARIEGAIAKAESE